MVIEAQVYGSVMVKTYLSNPVKSTITSLSILAAVLKVATRTCQMFVLRILGFTTI